MDPPPLMVLRRGRVIWRVNIMYDEDGWYCVSGESVWIEYDLFLTIFDDEMWEYRRW